MVMAEISAAKVKELRERTGAGFMDCKRALGWLGGTATALFLVPWAAVLGGLWRAAVGLLSE
jgi:hypothetical protein